jgi:prepilin-type N-terminal cleavage/methylation domain-containing protein
MKKTGIPKGFTLVEVLIVMSLIMIMASFAIPAYQHYTINSGMKTVAREIIADIINARQSAIARNVRYRLTFNTASNNYMLARKDADPAVTYSNVWPGPKNLNDFGKGVVFQNVNLNGGSILYFERRGTLTNPGTITLKNSVNSTATITAQMTGRAYAQYNMQK